MAESYSVNAVLSAKDNGFSSTLKNAMSAMQSFADKVKSGFSFKVLSGAGQQAFSMLKTGAQSLISEIDASNVAWKTFSGNMGIIGKGKDEINAVKKDLQSFAEQSTYTSGDMASAYTQLASVGTKNTTQLVKAFGGLATATDDPQEALKMLSQQAMQMATKPAVAWQDFNAMLKQAPTGIEAVAKEMGMSIQEMETSVQNGKVSTEEFFDAIQKVGTNESFTKLATEYKSTGDAMDGLKETLGGKLGPAFDVLSTAAIGGISEIIKKISEIDGEALAQKVSAGMKSAKPYWDAFVGIAKKVGQAIKVVTDFFIKHADTISKCIPYLLGAIAAFKGFKVLKSINPFGMFKKNAEEASKGASGAVSNSTSTIAQIINSLGNLMNSIGNVIKEIFAGIGTAAKGLGSGIKTALQGVATVAKGIGTGLQSAFKGIGTGLQSAFKGIGTALKIANPVNILALGAAISVVVVAFALLATQGEGIATILESIGTVIGTVVSTVITSLVNALVTLAPILPIIAQSLVMLSPLVIAFGAALSMVVLAIGQAVSSIITALTPVVEIIGGIFVQIAQIIADTIVRIIEALTPLLPVITEAFTTITNIISNAIVQIVEALAPYIPQMQQMVESTSQAIQAVCDAFTNLVSQIAPVIQSVSDLIKQLGETISEILEGMSEVITSVSDGIIGVIESIGKAISGVIDSIGGVFESLGNAVLNAGKGFELLANAIKMITGLNLIDMGLSLGVVATGIGAIVLASVGLPEAGAGMLAMANGLLGVSMNGASAAMAMVGIAGVITLLMPALAMLPAVLLSVGASFILFATGASSTADVVSALSIAMLIACVGVTTMAGALVMAYMSMSGFYESAKIAEFSLNSMKNAIFAVEMGLAALGNTANNAMNIICDSFIRTAMLATISGINVGKGFTQGLQSGLISAPMIVMTNMALIILTLSMGRSGVYIAGTNVGKGFSQGLQSGLTSAPVIVVANMGLIISTLRAGRNGAYSAGAYISLGFAQGMLSCLSVIRNAAAQMAAAAEKAVRAKAQIKSPSKVADKLGGYWGQGYVGGLLGMVKNAQRAAQNLVSVPTVATPNLAMSYSGGTAEDYDYYRNAEYTVVVPLSVDGKEFARTTATYTQEELDKRQVRDNRKRGRV